MPPKMKFLLLALLMPLCASAAQPNIVLIFTDDQGYNDLGCFGSTKIKTPNLDRMASEGLRLTSFYAQPVCGVSRAALMTGSYPIRVAEPGNVKQLHTVPHPEEVTMAEVLKSAGYATGIIGKWHLGNEGEGPGGFDPATMPNAQGFDYFYGTPRFNGFTVFVDDTPMRSPIMRNQEIVIEAVESWDHITADYTKEAIQYIDQHQGEPFFLYLAHNLPHIPVGASENFKGKSEYGPYGDTIEEIDWSTGQILDHLKKLGLDDNTLVVFTSDNGPWVETTAGMKPDRKPFIPRDHSGSADPFRGWKMSAWEGGSRVPFIARWPGKIPAGGVSDEILSTMDFLPTFASLAGADLPEDRTLDGHDTTSFLLGKSDTSPRDDYLYYAGCLLTGIRVDQWKLVLPRPNNPPGTGWWGRMIEAVEETQLFDLNADPGETTNVAKQNPEVVATLMKRIEKARTELGDMDIVGSGARFFDEGPRQVGAKPKAKRKPAAAAAFDNFKPVGNLRYSFETGLEGWKVIEGDFAEPITEMPSLLSWQDAPFARHGKQHLSTLTTGDDRGTDKQTGVLQSPSFVLEGDQVAFLIAGGFDEERLYLGLVDADSGEVLVRGGGSSDHLMRREVWDVSKWKGRSVYLQLVDQSPGGWGHLNVDDISVQGRLVVAAAAPSVIQPRKDAPNVVLIFADDLGYGDVGCYGATKVQTPNIDRLAAEGRRFTDAHSASAVCTPSRFGLLTGQYPIRGAGGQGLWGPAPVTSPLLIDTETLTIADVFKSGGYETAVFGKWHLGFGTSMNDWQEPLRPGPQDLGFDYYFGMPVVNSAPPYVYVENDRIVGADPADPLVLIGKGGGKATPITPIPLEASRRSPNQFSGAVAAHKLFNDYEVGTKLTEKATAWIKSREKKPFFLYFATTNIHHPFTPAKRFQGTSQAGLYGDSIHELDWIVGEVRKSLEDAGVADNTLVIFTSDNGGMFNLGGRHAAELGHKINGDLLGSKFGVWEGGHRVPFIAWWPGRIKPGTVSHQLMSSVDLMATFAAMVGRKLGENEGRDSISMLAALTEDSEVPLRNEMIVSPSKPSHVGMRKGEWMYIPAKSDGGFNGSKPSDHAWGGAAVTTLVNTPNSDIVNGKIKPGAPPAQLYRLDTDVNQTTNLYKEKPEVVSEMDALLKASRKATAPTRPATKRKKKP